MAQRPNYRLAEARALDLLSSANVSVPPINPVFIAENYVNVRVKFATFDLAKSASISGFYDSEDDVIFVNREEPPLRQTFTIAHEIGHKVLHEDWARSADYRVLLRDPREQDQDFREKEANAFAANLLMPRYLMNDYYDSLPVQELSRLFAVSVPAMRARLSFLYGI
jgi:Zn-dependent peptidase ImmA (M78 family)